MEMTNFMGVFVLAMVAASILSVGNADAYKGMNVPKGFFVWFGVTIAMFILGIATWFGTHMALA